MCKKVTTLFMAVFMILSCCISPAMAADSDLNYSEDICTIFPPQRLKEGAFRTARRF